MNKNKTMMFFFILSESFFFLALIISYVFYSHAGGELSSTAKYLDIKKTSIFTFFLLFSSIAIHMAGLKSEKGNRKALLGWLIFTIILGSVFLIGQGTEYANLISMNVTISQNVFGSSFFTLTGFHGLHVLLGLITLTILTIMIFSGSYKNVESTTLKSATMYWHFVDAVWIMVFTVVYVGAVV